MREKTMLMTAYEIWCLLDSCWLGWTKFCRTARATLRSSTKPTVSDDPGMDRQVTTGSLLDSVGYGFILLGDEQKFRF